MSRPRSSRSPVRGWLEPTITVKLQLGESQQAKSKPFARVQPTRPSVAQPHQPVFKNSSYSTTPKSVPQKEQKHHGYSYSPKCVPQKEHRHPSDHSKKAQQHKISKPAASASSVSIVNVVNNVINVQADALAKLKLSSSGITSKTSSNHHHQVKSGNAQKPKNAQPQPQKKAVPLNTSRSHKAPSKPKNSSGHSQNVVMLKNNVSVCNITYNK